MATLRLLKGHFLLTELLLPMIKRTGTAKAKSRIVIVSSIAHSFGFIMWHDVNWTKFYNSGASYAQSKLANVLHAKSLARKLEVTLPISRISHFCRVTWLLSNLSVLNFGFIRDQMWMFTVFILEQCWQTYWIIWCRQ